MLEEAGGWNEVSTTFSRITLLAMDRYRHRFMVLLIDFDGEEDRLKRRGPGFPTI